MLKESDLPLLIKASLKSIETNGASYYAWKQTPSHSDESETGWRIGDRTVSAEYAGRIYQQKMTSAYGERFAMSIGVVVGLVKNGYNIRLVRFKNEKNVEFNTKGWIIIVVESMPIFHIPPWDLNPIFVKKILENLDDNMSEDVKYKETNKVGEFTAMLQGSLTPGLDLLSIAKKFNEVDPARS